MPIPPPFRHIIAYELVAARTVAVGYAGVAAEEEVFRGGRGGEEECAGEVEDTGLCEWGEIFEEEGRGKVPVTELGRDVVVGEIEEAGRGAGLGEGLSGCEESGGGGGGVVEEGGDVDSGEGGV